MNTLKTYNLVRNDGKIVEPVFYKNNLEEVVEVLNIKNLKFEGKKTRDISKKDIHNAILNGQEKVYLNNKKSNIAASLSKKHLNKIISTIFIRDVESRHTYLKKELIANIDEIFYLAVPVLKHAELKRPLLYNTQIIHRFALPLKIGNLCFLVMITIKERIDYQEISIDEFTIYDFYAESKKSPDSSSTASARNNPVTFRSQYQVTKYIIYDLIEFVKSSIKKSNDEFINKKGLSK